MKPTLFLVESTDPHVDAVARVFDEHRAPFIRFDLDRYLQGNSIGISLIKSGEPAVTFEVGDHTFQDSEVGSIWFRAPQIAEAPPEVTDPEARSYVKSQITAFLRGVWRVLDSSHQFLNSPWAGAAEYKAYQLHVAAQLGFEIPITYFGTSASDVIGLERLFSASGGALLHKSVGTNLSLNDKGIQRVNYSTILTAEMLEEQCGRGSIGVAPSIYQQYTEKRFEHRVTVVDDEVFNVRIHSQDSERTSVDWRRYDLDLVRHEICELPLEIERMCICLSRKLGVRMSSIDLIETLDGRFVYLESNGKPSWLWLEQLTGIPISEAVFRALTRS